MKNPPHRGPIELEALGGHHGFPSLCATLPALALNFEDEISSALTLLVTGVLAASRPGADKARSVTAII